MEFRHGGIDVSRRQRAIEEVVSHTKEQSKAAKDELKDLDKARKGIEKDIEKHNNEILSLKSGIRDDWYTHEKLKTEEGELLQKITDQNLVVKSAEEELNQHKSN